MTLVLTILQLLSAVAVTVIVLTQSGKRSGLSGAIAGGADTFLSKGKAKTLDAKLAKATKWVGLVFVILTLALHFVLFKDMRTKSGTLMRPAFRCLLWMQAAARRLHNGTHER